MYVVIEYNQASRWPALYADTLWDTRDEALEEMERARTDNRNHGRMEAYAIASVVVEEAE